VQRQFRELEKLDPSQSGLAQSHANAVIELEEVVGSLRHYTDTLEMDPEQLAAIEERVSLFETLKRKYGGTLEKVIAFGRRRRGGCTRSSRGGRSLRGWTMR